MLTIIVPRSVLSAKFLINKVRTCSQVVGFSYRTCRAFSSNLDSICLNLMFISSSVNEANVDTMSSISVKNLVKSFVLPRYGFTAEMYVRTMFDGTWSFMVAGWVGLRL